MPEAGSIGQLLIHAAEADWCWIHCVIGGKSRSEFEDRELFHVMNDEDYSSRGHTAEFRLEHLKMMRDETCEALADVPDSDLEKFFSWKHNSGKEIEMSLRGILTHLIEHQATHKGQILMLKRLIG